MSNGRHSYIAFYPSDWIAGTARMTPMQELVYFRVCVYNWDKAEACPATELPLMLGAIPDWQVVLLDLVHAGKLVESADGSVANPRALESAQEALRLWSAKSSGGKTGAKKTNARKSAAATPAESAVEIPVATPAETVAASDDDTGAGLPSHNQNQNQTTSVAKATGASAPARLFPELERTPPAKPSAPTSDPDEAVIPLYLVVVGEGNHSKALFGHGLAFVRRVTRKGENEARTLIGKWRSSLRNDDKRLWELLVSADRVEGGVADLPSWIGARLRAGPPGARSSEPDDGLTPTARAIIADQNARREAEKGAA